MLIQCPDCQTKMVPKPPAGTAEGTRVSIKCRCGTVLRFRMPAPPKPAANANTPRIEDIMRGIGKWPL